MMQRQPSLVANPDGSCGDGRGHVVHCLRLRAVRDRVDEHELVAGVVGHQRESGHREVTRAVGGVHSDGAGASQYGVIEFRVRVRRDLDDKVDAPQVPRSG